MAVILVDFKHTAQKLQVAARSTADLLPCSHDIKMRSHRLPRHDDNN